MTTQYPLTVAAIEAYDAFLATKPFDGVEDEDAMEALRQRRFDLGRSLHEAMKAEMGEKIRFCDRPTGWLRRKVAGESIDPVVDEIDRILAEEGLKRVTLWNSLFPFRPDIYPEGECLSITGDGLACTKFLKKPDGTWVFMPAYEYGRNGHSGETYVLDSQHMRAFWQVFSRDPDDMVGQPVTPEQMYAFVRALMARWS